MLKSHAAFCAAYGVLTMLSVTMVDEDAGIGLLWSPETAARLARAATQLGRAATAHAVEVATVAAADGLDAFGSEVEPKVKVEVRPAVAPAKPKAGAPAVQAAVVAKWLVVILLSAGIAVAGLIGYQRRSTVLHAGIRRGRA